MGEHDSPDQLLGGPAVANKLPGQIVEQLRIRRTVSHDAEVVDRRDDALTEQVCPDTVHRDPRGKRVLRTCQPIRQLRSATPLRVDCRSTGHSKGSEEAARDSWPVTLFYAANAHGSVT